MSYRIQQAPLAPKRKDESWAEYDKRRDEFLENIGPETKKKIRRIQRRRRLK